MDEIGETSRDSIATYGLEALMTITKDDIRATLAHLAELFPHTFALEKHQPHRPLKVGIYSDIVARCPDLTRGKLGTVLNIYTRRVAYLQCIVAGAFRVDLDGCPAGEVGAAHQEYAAAMLAEINVAREAKRTATATPKNAVRVRQVAAAPQIVPVLKGKPVLRLPAFKSPPAQAAG